MRYSTLEEEERLWRKGYRLVAGIDEVGRGPLAGPVVAAAVCILSPTKDDSLVGLRMRDSKQLSPGQRDEFYKILINHPALEWGIGRVYPKGIDRMNIYQATKLAMVRALRSLEKKLGREVGHLILDGNITLDVSVPQKAIIKADEQVFSCAAASIIAKVKRDRLMARYHKKYLVYGFDKHKGYGTKIHLAALKKHGPSSIHRLSFAPVLA